MKEGVASSGPAILWYLPFLGPGEGEAHQSQHSIIRERNKTYHTLAFGQLVLISGEYEKLVDDTVRKLVVFLCPYALLFVVFYGPDVRMTGGMTICGRDLRSQTSGVH